MSIAKDMAPLVQCIASCLTRIVGVMVAAVEIDIGCFRIAIANDPASTPVVMDWYCKGGTF